MKKAFLFLGAIAAAAIAGGVAASYVVGSIAPTNVEVVTREVERAPQLGSQFTTYSPNNYPDLTYAAENAVQAVVNIEVIQQVEMSQGRSRSYDPFLEFFGIPQQQQQRGESQPRYREQRSGGSGVIITEDGYIVTNNHVVDGASKLRVKIYDGGTFDAEIIGVDPTTDIALIKIDKDNLPTIPFGSSDDLRLGEWVLAIGSPFDLQSTITAGIVSAKARQLDVIPNDFRIESFIQTDAAVNPGNSGGALVNSRGELVGINTLIKSQTGSYIGYSFAVPETLVRKVVTDLKESGVVQRALLGVSFLPITQEFVDAQGKDLGVTEVGGVYVSSVVDGSAASEAGIRKGDIITSVNDVKLGPKVSLQEQIAKHRPNDKVKISVKRDGSVKLFDVTLRNNAAEGAEQVAQNTKGLSEILGGRFADANQKLCEKLEIRGGVEVVSIVDGGVLSRSSVRKGFIITHINDRRVVSMAELSAQMDNPVSIDGVYPDGRSASYNLVK
ncbi:MAG: trypsin-like peptidase domain-containing protein [Rikenellaceae bacterium]